MNQYHELNTPQDSAIVLIDHQSQLLFGDGNWKVLASPRGSVKTALGLVTAALLFHSITFAADTYTVDPAHTSVTFSVRHLGINSVKGKFKEFNGALVLDGDTLKEASGTIQVKSVDTGVEKRDNHLRTADFFDAAKYPTIVFKTKRVENGASGHPVLIADFTMRGVTKELRLPANMSKPTKDPWGGVRVGLEAKTKLNRKDYGINYHEVLETGAMAVGEEVELEINTEAVKEAATKTDSEKK
jgi:polyisoprenoid-binding protein YceI